MSVYGDQHCYRPDGQWTDDHIPCSRVKSQVTSCCLGEDTCTTTGFCISTNLTGVGIGNSPYYTSSCTDGAYKPGCENYCPSASTSAGIRQCSDSTWCCILNADVNCCTGDSVFNANLGTSITTDQRLSLTSGSSSPTQTPDSSNLSTAAAAGIGVGAGIGILLLGLFITAFVLRIRRNKQAQRNLEYGIGKGVGNDVRYGSENGFGYGTENGGWYRPESSVLGQQQQQALNMHYWKPGQPVELLDANDGRHELQGPKQSMAVELPTEAKLAK